MNKYFRSIAVVLFWTLGVLNAPLFAVESGKLIDALVSDSSLSSEEKLRHIAARPELHNKFAEAFILIKKFPDLSLDEVLVEAGIRNHSKSKGATSNITDLNNLNASDAAPIQTSTNYKQILREAAYVLNPEQRQHEIVIANLMAKIVSESTFPAQTIFDLGEQYAPWLQAVKEANRGVERKKKGAINKAATRAVKKLVTKDQYRFSVFASKRILASLGLLSLIVAIGSRWATTAAWEPNPVVERSSTMSMVSQPLTCPVNSAATTRKSSPRPRRTLA